MIHVLDPIVANGIAAGEVIERPASVVKELTENSLDAGASMIHVSIEQGGIKSLTVTDNGCGMTAEDAKLAFERHATSKLTALEDLESLVTMGFRGEALASIAAVSRVTLTTRRLGDEDGYRIAIEAGKVVSEGPCGCQEGTSITVEDLFYNTPARYKFLKRDSTEAGYIQDLIVRMALARPDVSFRLFKDGKEMLHTPGNNDLLSVIYVVYGKDTATASVSVEHEHEEVSVSGYITKPEVARGNRGRYIFMVNGRVVQSRTLQTAVDEASKTWYMKGKFPTVVLKLDLPLHLVDVNVHPQKLEVRFWNDQTMFRAVYHAVRNALESGGDVTQTDIPEAHANVWRTDDYDREVKTRQAPRRYSEKDFPNEDYPERETKRYPHAAGGQMSFRDQSGGGHRSVSPNRGDFMPPPPPVPASGGDSDRERDHISTATETAPKPVEPERMEIDLLTDARLIGQLFHTYLLFEYRDSFLLLDQHAAHERILYERLLQRRDEREDHSVARQVLLQPETVEVTLHQMAVWEEQEDSFLKLGFEAERFGDTALLLRAVPDTGDKEFQPVAAFKVLLDRAEKHRLDDLDDEEELFHTMACKAAVKAHDKLSEREMLQLVEDLQTLKNPYHCPHGRPLIVQISRYAIEKMFRRIV